MSIALAFGCGGFLKTVLKASIQVTCHSASQLCLFNSCNYYIYIFIRIGHLFRNCPVRACHDSHALAVHVLNRIAAFP